MNMNDPHQRQMLFACTSLAITDTQKNIYHGRTLEFSSGDVPSLLSYFPVGSPFSYKAPDGVTNGFSCQSQYPILAITAPLDPENKTHVFLEGVNSEGLSFSLNMMQNSALPPLSPEQYSKALPTMAIGEWALAQFATVDQIQTAIQQNSVAFWTQKIPQLHDVESPIHFIFYDKKGGCVVVEASHQQLQVHNNPTRCLTNGPEFPWHLTNLNNYTHLTNRDQTIARLGQLDLRQPDSGIAVSSLPSSDTSVARFVRAVFYSTYAYQVADPDSAILELSHIMNKFDRPKNATIYQHDPEKGADEPYITEYTLWTSLTDLSRGHLFVRSYANLNYEKYTFEQFADQKTAVFKVLS